MIMLCEEGQDENQVQRFSTRSHVDLQLKDTRGWLDYRGADYRLVGGGYNQVEREDFEDKFCVLLYCRV